LTGVDARPPIRTFQPRRRRLSARRQQLLDSEGPRWMIDVAGPRLGRGELIELFGREAPAVLEIGIGRGEALLEIATADPDSDVIGVDVHTPGIAAVVLGITNDELTNIRLVHGDVLEFLDRISPDVLAGVRVFFPDPWPKLSQRHKRLVNAANLDRFVAVLEPGGWLHLATDIADYAEQMQHVADAHPELTGGPIARPGWRPLTRYEQRGLDAGRTVTDLWYVRAPRVVTSSSRR
jgi:tRNA (guanine-N7-)-methyltransferase